MLIRSILRWKTALALKRSCNFSRAKIERINTVARHVLLHGAKEAKKHNLNQWSPSWWRHQMETFSALLALCEGNHFSPVDSPHKGQWRGALMFSLICSWTYGWANNRDAGDLRRHRTHHEVTVIWSCGTYGAREGDGKKFIFAPN